MSSLADIERAVARHLKDAWLYESTLGGDVYVLRFSNDLCLVAHRLRTSRQDDIRRALSQLGPSVHDGVEPEEVEVGVACGRNARRVVESVQIRADGTLVLDFGSGWSLEATTDTDIVDWQWSLGPQPRNPYVVETVAHYLFELQEGSLMTKT